jgi:hypothetical protein
LTKSVAVHPIAPGFLEIAARIAESFRDDQLQLFNLEFLNVYLDNNPDYAKPSLRINRKTVSFLSPDLLRPHARLG